MVARYDEQGIVFDCEGENLLGVVARPEQPNRCGVLIVVGGPQYRVGSHRQFVLLARHLAEHSIPSMRFDYRGMGDSSGALRNFEGIQADIREAVDRFCTAVPEVEEVVLWGLCDAASAAALYAVTDRRVAGLVLLNPWVRTEVGEAKTYLKHYYLQRATDLAFWKKAFSGKFDARASLASFAGTLRRVTNGKRVAFTSEQRDRRGQDLVRLPHRMLVALERFQGRILFILSGNDLTAKEFADVVASSPRWADLIRHEKVQRVDLREANHTFSSRAWRDRVAECTRTWVLADA